MKSVKYLALLAVAAIVLSACAAPTPEVVEKVVEKQVEKVITATPEPMKPKEDTGSIFILGAFRGEEESYFQGVIDAFEAANPDIDVLYSGTAEFETLINVRVEAGDPPDLAAIPQPGLMKKFAADGELTPLWPEVLEIYDTNYSPAWKDLGSADGTPYGLFHRVNAKGWIWYNKPAFAAAGYEVPATWDELVALTDEIKADGEVPWCVSIGSGASTGWPGTDWIENILLRMQPVDVYDKWVNHEILFDSPEIRGAWAILQENWLDEGMAYGGPATIATTDFKDSPQWMFDDPPKCWLHMQGSFVTNFFSDEIRADLDNQLGVFMMPKIDPDLPTTLEVGGDMWVVFKKNDRPEVRRFVEFLGTGAAANPWIKVGGALFPHQDQDLSLYPTEIERNMAEAILTAEAARFDGSDAMVSSGNVAFWKGITDWVGGKSVDDTLAEIDAGF